jgi:hypothetical protein
MSGRMAFRTRRPGRRRKANSLGDSSRGINSESCSGPSTRLGAFFALLDSLLDSELLSKIDSNWLE